MTNHETITISRAEYDALVSQNAELEDYVAALKADDGSRIPHPVAPGHYTRRQPLVRVSQLPRAYAAPVGRSHRAGARLYFGNRAWRQVRISKRAVTARRHA